MSKQLGNAQLVSVDAFGHCILGDSSCTDQIAAAYLIDLTMPGPGTVCHPDVQPFPAPMRQAGSPRTAGRRRGSPAGAASEPERKSHSLALPTAPGPPTARLCRCHGAQSTP